jgi:hypothetical protein
VREEDWSEGSQSLYTVKYGHEFSGTRNQEPSAKI